MDDLVANDIYQKGFTSLRNYIPQTTVKNIANNATTCLTHLFQNKYRDFQRFGATLPFVWELRTHPNIISLYKHLYKVQDDHELLSSLETFQFIPHDQFKGRIFSYRWNMVDFNGNPSFLTGFYNACRDIDFYFVEHSPEFFEPLKNILIGSRSHKVAVRNNSDCTKKCFNIWEQELTEAMWKLNAEYHHYPPLKISKIRLVKGDLVIMDPRLLIKLLPAPESGDEPMMVIPITYHNRNNVSHIKIKRLFSTFITGGRSQCNLAKLSRTGIGHNFEIFGTFRENDDFLKKLAKCPIFLFTADITRNIILPSLVRGRGSLSLFLLGATNENIADLEFIMGTAFFLSHDKEINHIGVPDRELIASCANLEICQNYVREVIPPLIYTKMHPTDYMLVAIIRKFAHKEHSSVK